MPFNVTTISRQAPFKLEYVDGLLPEHRTAVEALLQQRVGAAGAEVRRKKKRGSKTKMIS